jgi:hypothetical protein
MARNNVLRITVQGRVFRIQAEHDDKVFWMDEVWGGLPELANSFEEALNGITDRLTNEVVVTKLVN